MSGMSCTWSDAHGRNHAEALFGSDGPVPPLFRAPTLAGVGAVSPLSIRATCVRCGADALEYIETLGRPLCVPCAGGAVRYLWNGPADKVRG